MNKFSRSIAAFIVGISAATPSVATADWSIAGLGTLGGTNSSARGINDAGQVVGKSNLPGGDEHAFITGANGAGMTDLGTLGGTMSSASAINASGQVVGFSDMADGKTQRAFITGPNGTGMTDLGTPSGQGNSYATSINNSGQVVGNYFNPDYDFVSYPFITGPNGTGMTDLANEGLRNAYDINDSGRVVGWFYEIDDGTDRAYTTGPNGAGTILLGSLGGDEVANSFANANNDSGQVVGYSYITRYYHHAFVTGPNGAGMTDLGTLGGGESASSKAFDINNSGQVVGTADTSAGDSHAFMYSHNGGMIDLSLLPAVTAAGWTSLTPQAINNHGQIAGYGIHLGHTEAFLLSPVPEPQTYAMLLAGLGVLGFMARRKKESIV